MPGGAVHFPTPSRAAPSQTVAAPSQTRPLQLDGGGGGGEEEGGGGVDLPSGDRVE